jgi:hypothetical protein
MIVALVLQSQALRVTPLGRPEFRAGSGVPGREADSHHKSYATIRLSEWPNGDREPSDLTQRHHKGTSRSEALGCTTASAKSQRPGKGSLLSIHKT